MIIVILGLVLVTPLLGDFVGAASPGGWAFSNDVSLLNVTAFNLVVLALWIIAHWVNPQPRCSGPFRVLSRSFLQAMLLLCVGGISLIHFPGSANFLALQTLCAIFFFSNEFVLCKRLLFWYCKSSKLKRGWKIFTLLLIPCLLTPYFDLAGDYPWLLPSVLVTMAIPGLIFVVNQEWVFSLEGTKKAKSLFFSLSSLACCLTFSHSLGLLPLGSQGSAAGSNAFLIIMILFVATCRITGVLAIAISLPLSAHYSGTLRFLQDFSRIARMREDPSAMQSQLETMFSGILAITRAKAGWLEWKDSGTSWGRKALKWNIGPALFHSMRIRAGRRDMEIKKMLSLTCHRDLMRASPTMAEGYSLMSVRSLAHRGEQLAVLVICEDRTGEPGQQTRAIVNGYVEQIKHTLGYHRLATSRRKLEEEGIPLVAVG